PRVTDIAPLSELRYWAAPTTPASGPTATQAAAEPAPLAPGTVQTYTVKGLARQRQYYFAIVTTDDVGNTSGLSNLPSATTTDTLGPAAIRDLTAPFVWLGGPPVARASREVPP